MLENSSGSAMTTHVRVSEGDVIFLWMLRTDELHLANFIDSDNVVARQKVSHAPDKMILDPLRPPKE